MGWRYRKTTEKGPFRFTFSRSGVSKSVGNRLFRFTDSARGGKRLTFTLPGTGLSWVKTLGGGRRRATR